MIKFKSFLENQEKIDNLLNNLILFFKIKGKIFGAPEESRIAFSRLKNNDDDIEPEARFTGIDLLKALFGSEGDSIQSAFGPMDIPDIHICDKDDVIQQLMNHKPKKEKK